MGYILFISIILFLIVFVQDVGKRAIWWFLPLAIFALGCYDNFIDSNWLSLLWNVLFVSFLMTFLFLYIKLRFKNSQNGLFSYFGLGDLMILIAITPYFSFNIFVYIFTFGTTFSLIAHLIASIFKAQKTVPYAGYISIFMAVVLVFNHFNILSL